jgi:hypothetical protein
VLGTYLSFAVLIGAAAATGALVFRLCGRREWSWLAPALGLGVLCGVGWGAANLIDPVATLVVLLAALAYGAFELLVRRPALDGELTLGLIAAVGALVLASIPFLVEGRFGILGTGLNPDMSQHLFATDRIASGGVERLIEEGYPLGPHALVAGLGELGVSFVHGFDGFALAIAVAAALASLPLLVGICSRRALAVALLTAFAYLASSYLIQGAFKESLQALFLLAFAVALHEIAAGSLGGADPAPRWRLCAVLPPAGLAVGSIYAYSFPGVAWLAGTAMIWVAWEAVAQLRSRGADAAVGNEAGRPSLGALLTPALVALCVFVLAVAPELGRLSTFASFETFDPEGPGRGNLFDAISPFEALGVWPSGDFRVEPGAGAAPAVVFWLGGALAVLALGLGLAIWVRRGERALPAALAAGAALWLYPTLFGTIYQAAKALAIVAPVVMLISARGLALAVPPRRELRLAAGDASGLAIAGLALAFALAAAGSSLLVLVNGPVGPDRWSPALIEMRERGELGRNGEAGDSTLVVATPEVMEGEHGADLFLWELRGGRVCAQALEPGQAGADQAPPGIAYVVQHTGAGADAEPHPEPPFAGLAEVRRAELYTLYRVGEPEPEPAAEPPCPFIADGQRADPSG